VCENIIARNIEKTQCFASGMIKIKPKDLREIFTLFLSDVTLQAHFIQRPFVLPSSTLHDSSEE
jgi:hypothetical protein